MTLYLMLGACVAGALVRVFEEWLRREQVALALTVPFDREESRRAEQVVATLPFYEQWLLSWLMFTSPRRMVARLRRHLARASADHGDLPDKQ